MISMAELELQIRAVEGFDVRLATRGGARSVVIEPYPFERRAPRAWTCTEWRTRRVESHYPDLLVHVLTVAGVVTHGRTKLDVVRGGYDTESHGNETPVLASHPGAGQRRRSFWARFGAPIVVVLGIVKAFETLNAADAQSLWSQLLTSAAR
jgi:hypothetical protein